VVDVGGAINHGDHCDHCLQTVGGLHLAPEEKLGALFHEEKAGVVVFFLAATCGLVQDLHWHRGAFWAQENAEDACALDGKVGTRVVHCVEQDILRGA
jgi:hypothetical protein